MKLASYKSVRSGFMGLGNILIRLRLRGMYSHTEIVFEDGDFVDDLLPDGTASITSEGLWAVSSVGLERLPSFSKIRAGKIGGVRFKRIQFDKSKWDLLDISDCFNARDVAIRAKQLEGTKYDWLLIWNFIAWIIPQNKKRYMCNEICGELLGLKESWRTDPCSFRNIILLLKEKVNAYSYID